MPGGVGFSIKNIPLEDKPTYALLKAANTTAIFQLESHGMKKLIAKLQPDTFEDIVALVALYRPGPLESGMVDDFINRKHGRSKADYFHPELEVSLKPTYGVIVYQEQVMQIAQISQICQIDLFVQISQICLFVCFFRFVSSDLFLQICLFRFVGYVCSGRSGVLCPSDAFQRLICFQTLHA